jgi:glycosyltransferase involved in cell wall biosynthesis
MSGTPSFTVIIPTYNWSTVLPYSIASVLNQTFTDLELLVVGDGCTDDSENVVRSIQDPRLRWHNLPKNSGQQGAPNNWGIENARGKWIAYLGHDDLWLPGHLQTVSQTLEKGADVVFSICALLAPPGIISRYTPLKPEYKPGKWYPPSAFAHTTLAARAVKGWRLFSEIDIDPEADLLSRLHAGGARFEYLPRLGTLKFPAAMRKNVYKERPCHEQKEWLARIKSESDLERQVLAYLLLEAKSEEAIEKRKSRFSHRQWLKKLRGYKEGVFNPRRILKGLDPL